MDREIGPVQEVRAMARGIRMSPRKVRLLVDLVRGKPVTEALAILRFMPQAAAEPVAKAVRSAAANAENNYSLDIARLRVTKIVADTAPTLKRLKPRARGRADRIARRASHITVIVSNE